MSEISIGPQSHTQPQPIQGNNLLEPQQITPNVQGPNVSEIQAQPVIAESGKGLLIDVLG